MYVFVVIVLLIAIYLLFRLLRLNRGVKDMLARRRAIAAMPVAEVKERVLPVLANPAYFSCVPADAAPPSVVMEFAPELQALFTQYRSIRALNGDAVLEWPALAPYLMDAHYTVIGSDVRDTVIAVKPGEEAVYEFDGTEQCLAAAFSDPTIYHFLLVLIEDLYPEAMPGR